MGYIGECNRVNAYTMSYMESSIKFLHQCLFFPLKQKLIKAIENNQLTTWPGLIVKAVEKYLPNHASATQTRAI